MKPASNIASRCGAPRQRGRTGRAAVRAGVMSNCLRVDVRHRPSRLHAELQHPGAGIEEAALAIDGLIQQLLITRRVRRHSALVRGFLACVDEMWWEHSWHPSSGAGRPGDVVTDAVPERVEAAWSYIQRGVLGELLRSALGAVRAAARAEHERANTKRHRRVRWNLLLRLTALAERAQSPPGHAAAVSPAASNAPPPTTAAQLCRASVRSALLLGAA